MIMYTRLFFSSQLNLQTTIKKIYEEIKFQQAQTSIQSIGNNLLKINGRSTVLVKYIVLLKIKLGAFVPG